MNALTDYSGLKKYGIGLFAGAVTAASIVAFSIATKGTRNWF
jgi:hypothetical protein